MSLALVTGGTQRLGAVIAARLAADGYDLALHYNGSAQMDPDLTPAVAACGVRAQTFQADLSGEGAAARLITAVRERFGRAPDLLVNNASRFGEDTIESVSRDDLMGHFAVNAAAPALLAQSFAQALRDAPGAIINILDQRLTQPHGDNFAYTVSKFALAGLTQMLARILAPRIRVNAVAPGLTLPTADYGLVQLTRIARAMPLETLPDPSEIADAAAWLARSPSVTGETIHVDGGARHRSFSGDFDRL